MKINNLHKTSLFIPSSTLFPRVYFFKMDDRRAKPRIAFIQTLSLFSEEGCGKPDYNYPFEKAVLRACTHCSINTLLYNFMYS